MQALAKKRITVMGLGTHGGAVGNIRWLHEQGAQLIVTDLKSAEELSESVRALNDLTDIEWVLGEHRLDDFLQADMVLRNPAVPRDSVYLTKARQAGVPIEMDSSLFFRFCPTSNIIGVTGSKGKTTTTNALAHLLTPAYPHVAKVGIEGTSPLAALDSLGATDAVVFELSSWRIEALAEHKLSPHTAIITSLYRDHLNTYDSFEQYVQTKRSLIEQQDVQDRVLLNYDDERVRSWATAAPGRVLWYSLGPSTPGDGICVDRGEITIQYRNERAALFPLSALPLRGEHEQRNMLPAILLAFTAGVRPDSIKLHLEHVSALPHRLEEVRMLDGVAYINDSAATIPDATIAAISSFPNKHIVLIAGGSDKDLQFEDLATALANTWIRGLVFLPGNATERMISEITGAYRSLPPVHQVDSMAAAVAKARELARPHDVVLLSPGATSFGLFQHEFDRGDQFRAAVRSLQ